MTPDGRRTRVLRLFEQALEREGPDRTAFLDGLPDADRELRTEIEALLAITPETRFLRTPSPEGGGGPLLEVASLPGEGDVVGSYRILRRIGTGGMGAVYEAEQESPRRVVALKLMRPEVVSAATLRRFRYEAEILGHLNHPGIAKVHETGVAALGSGSTRQEVPFFAMEYVEGARPLLEHARELSRDERLTMFMQVCDAVQHGHQKGIIHRDLKPTNLLVDASGQPKVIDFGVARAAGADLAVTGVETSPGQLLGTFQYMSPEQFETGPHAVDVRSDVYSLGVVLYQLLCDGMPYELEDKGVHEMARIIRDQPPRRPEPPLPRALEAILFKALDKDRERRYASVTAMAADVRRFLRDEPVEARPPSVAYQLRMFTRRHRALVSSLATIIVVLTVALAVTLDQRDEAVTARGRADGLLTELLDSNLELVFDYAQRIRRLPGSTQVSHDMLAQAVTDLTRLQVLADDDPAIRWRVAEATLRLGDVQGNPRHSNLGDTAAALASYERAHAEADALVAESPQSPDARRVLALAERNLAEMARAAGRLDEAQQRLQAALALFESLADESDDPEHRGQLAQTHGSIAFLYGGRRELDACRTHAFQQRELLQRLIAEHPDDNVSREMLGLNHKLVAGLPYVEGDYEAALAEYGLAAAVFEGLVERHPDEAPYIQQAADARMWCGSMLLLLGRDAEAETAMRAALAAFESLQALDPDDRKVLPALANAVFSVGRLLVGRAERAEADEAGAFWERALDEFRRSQSILTSLEAEGYATGTTRGTLDRIQAEIDRCEEQLAAGASGP